MTRTTWLVALLAGVAVGCTVSDRSYEEGEDPSGGSTSASGGSGGPDGSVGTNTGHGNGGGGSGGEGGSEAEGGSGGSGGGSGASVSSPDGSTPSAGGGAGGTQNTNDDSGVSTQCDPNDDEDCFNGVDDDCNQLADCADPACSEAVCAPAADVPGVLVEIGEECPPGYREEEIELHQRLSGGGCTGCSCTSTPTECTASVYIYQNDGDCAADTGPTFTGGTFVGDVTEQCPSSPLEQGNWPGWRVGAITTVGQTGRCVPQGTAAPEPATWAVDGKFCVASRAGVGCQFGYACLPATDVGTPCGETEDVCPGSLTEQTWHEDFDDTRTCGTCACDGDGDCDGAIVEMGSDWACLDTGANLRSGEKLCANTPYSPPARIVGSIQQPSCDASVTTSGAVVATGEHTLCCE